jgi:hypothetical protein
MNFRNASRRLSWLALLSTGLLCLASCDDGEAASGGDAHQHGGVAVDPVAIVATTPDLADLARQVGGEHVEITTIADGEEDPHAIDVTPGMVRALADADLLMIVGYGLEEAWLPDLVDGAKNEATVEGGEGRFVAGDSLRSIEGDSGFRGSVHAENNPHFLAASAAASVASAQVPPGYAITDLPHHCSEVLAFLKPLPLAPVKPLLGLHSDLRRPPHVPLQRQRQVARPTGDAGGRRR